MSSTYNPPDRCDTAPMANIVPNIALGRAVELYHRVDSGDPAAARLYVIPISAGAVTDATLKDADDFAAMVTAGVTERTANGWNRKTLTGADLAAIAPDDANDRFPIDIADQSWTPTADAVTDLVVCYASVSSPTNAQLMPLVVLDWAVTGTGATEVANINDLLRAS